MEKLIVSSSPHLRSGASTQRIMLDVIIALCPALVASFVFFGSSIGIRTETAVVVPSLAGQAIPAAQSARSHRG